MSILLTGYCDNKQNEKYKVYERLTEISNGQVYDIRSDSIGHILDDFITKLDNHHVLLTSFYAAEADSSRWDFSVDKTVDTLELIISGERPKVWIYSPNGKMVKYWTETVSLTHVKGYTVNSPHNGTWQIDVESKSAHSVRITADSKLRFSYGFSVQSPTSMLDTHLFPVKGNSNSSNTDLRGNVADLCRNKRKRTRIIQAYVCLQLCAHNGYDVYASSSTLFSTQLRNI